MRRIATEQERPGFKERNRSPIEERFWTGGGQPTPAVYQAGLAHLVTDRYVSAWFASAHHWYAHGLRGSRPRHSRNLDKAAITSVAHLSDRVSALVIHWSTGIKRRSARTALDSMGVEARWFHRRSLA
jgi:hypothetical protein